jgi:hypothetical protein
MPAQPPTSRAAHAAGDPPKDRTDRLRIRSLSACAVLALAATSTLTACTTTGKEPAITLTAAEAATIAETTIKNAAQAASLADKLHREVDPDTDDVVCYDNNGDTTGLARIRRAYTIEGLQNDMMMTGARGIREHLTKNGWVITNDRTTARPEYAASGINDSNDLYASIDAGNHGILIFMSSGCLKPGTLTSSPSTST